MPEPEALVVEVWKKDAALAMSVFERHDTASTLRHYSQCQVSFGEILRLCREMAILLSVASRKHYCDNSLLEQIKKSGQFLWGHLLTKPIKERLRQARGRSLVLLLDEELIALPWELLHDGDDFLCLRYNLGRQLRTRQEPLPGRSQENTAAISMLILADPTAELASCYREGIEIRNRLDHSRGKIRVDFKSTSIDTLYVKKNLCEYDWVHFAGHCEYDSLNPDASGWALTGARFTARNISALAEAGLLPSLVFSNACHSARGEFNSGQDDCQAATHNLATAFLLSGVRHYIGAVWYLHDAAALSFAQAFYARLMRGQCVGESLRQSRMQLLKEFGPGHFSWAGYLLYGDPASQVFKAAAVFSPPARIPLIRRKPARKLLLVISGLAALFFLALALQLWLPAFNPGTQFSYRKIEELLRRGNNAVAIFTAESLIKKNPNFLPAYPLLAQAYTRLGNAKEALRYYFDYMLQGQRRNDNKSLADAYIKIGWLYQGQGESKKAFDFYQKALGLSRATKDALHQAIALRKLAVWYMDDGQYDKALELLTKSSEINRRRQSSWAHRYQLACDYFDIGLVFANKDDPAAAKDFYRKSFNLFSQMRLTSELSDYYFNLGEIHLFDKEYQKALECYRLGLKIDQVQGNLPGLASDYNMLGELYFEMDNFKEAEEAFLKTISLAGGVSLPQEEAEAWHHLGRLYALTRQKNKAREAFSRAQEFYFKSDQELYQEIRSELRLLEE